MIAKSISSARSSITLLLALGVLAFAAVGWSQEATTSNAPVACPPAANQASQTTTEKREETLRAEHQVLPDPGTLVDYRKRVGTTFCFQVTGRLQNQTDSAVQPGDARGTTDLSLEPYPYRMVWGDGIYTDDSPLALTAVQAGLP